MASISTQDPWKIGGERRTDAALPKVFLLGFYICLPNARHLTSNRQTGHLKLIGVSEARPTAYHFRDQGMHEVDIVLERNDGMIAAIEIKAGATVTNDDFSGLRKLAEARKGKFAFGAVLYDSDVIVPFGRILVAAPLSCIWN